MKVIFKIWKNWKFWHIIFLYVLFVKTLTFYKCMHHQWRNMYLVIIFPAQTKSCTWNEP